MLHFLNHAPTSWPECATTRKFGETPTGRINRLVGRGWYRSAARVQRATNKSAEQRTICVARSSVESGQVDDIAQSAAPLGRVLSVSGSQAQVRLRLGASDERATVGKFL